MTWSQRLYRIFVCPFWGHDTLRFHHTHCVYCGKEHKIT